MLANEEAGLDSASLRDLRSVTDLALRATKATAQAIGRSMSSLLRVGEIEGTHARHDTTPYRSAKDPGPRSPWIRHLRNLPEQPGRKRRGPSLATTGPPSKQPLLCLSAPHLALGAEQSVFMDPHYRASVSDRCDSRQNETHTFSKREQKLFSAYHKHPAFMQPICTAVSTPCHAGRGLAGHPRCVNVGNDYGKMRLYTPIRSKTTVLQWCVRHHSAQRERLSPSRILAQSQVVFTSHKTLLVSLLYCLVLRVNFAKSILSSSKRVSFLGTVIDSVQITATVSAERAMTIQRHAASFTEGTARPLKAFQRMLDLMAAASPVLQLGLLHITPPVLAEAEGSIRGLASWTPRRNSDSGLCISPGPL